MSVLLINQGWTDNLGDIAIGEVMERELAEFSPITVEFAPIVMKKTKGVLSKILGLYSLDNKYREWIDAKLNTIGDHISGAIIGGGELFASNSNFNAAVKIWVEQLGERNIPIYIFGVGGGVHKCVVSNKVSKCSEKSEWGVCTRSLFKNCI